MSDDTIRIGIGRERTRAPGISPAAAHLECLNVQPPAESNPAVAQEFGFLTERWEELVNSPEVTRLLSVLALVFTAR